MVHLLLGALAGSPCVPERQSIDQGMVPLAATLAHVVPAFLKKHLKGVIEQMSRIFWQIVVDHPSGNIEATWPAKLAFGEGKQVEQEPPVPPTVRQAHDLLLSVAAPQAIEPRFDLLSGIRPG